MRLRAQEGFTLLELLMALVLLSGGILALASTLDGSRRVVDVSERVEVLSHLGEQEMERLLALDYNQLGHPPGTLPSLNGSKNHPDFYVSGTKYTWDQDATPRSDELAQVATGEVGPSTTWVDRSTGTRLTGRIHRYVTWTDDPCCAGTEDSKRVTVAVTIDGNQAPRRPLLISSVVIDPSKGG